MKSISSPSLPSPLFTANSAFSQYAIRAAVKRARVPILAKANGAILPALKVIAVPVALAIIGYPASVAFSVAASLYNRICHVIRMPFWAMRSRRISGCKSLPAELVDFSCHWLQMSGIYARMIPTEMINFQAIGYRANHLLVCVSMRLSGKPNGAVEDSVTVQGQCCPKPAGRAIPQRPAFVDLSPKPDFLGASMSRGSATVQRTIFAQSVDMAAAIAARMGRLLTIRRDTLASHVVILADTGGKPRTARAQEAA